MELYLAGWVRLRGTLSGLLVAVPGAGASTHACWDVIVTANLYPGLGQPDLDGELLPGEHVWVVGAREGLLELLQLEAGEGGAVAALFPHLGDGVLVPAQLAQLGPGVRARGAGG